MGIETAILVTTAVVAGATAYEQRQQAKTAAKERKEANAISQAEQAAQQTAQTRQQIREERIRRAQIAQSSQNTGVAGSSGEIGSIGALQTNIGSNIAAASRQANAATGISDANQRSADAVSSAQETGAIGGLLTSVIGIGANAAGLFGTQATPTNATTTNQSPVEVPNPYDVNNLFGPKR